MAPVLPPSALLKSSSCWAWRVPFGSEVLRLLIHSFWPSVLGGEARGGGAQVSGSVPDTPSLKAQGAVDREGLSLLWEPCVPLDSLVWYEVPSQGSCLNDRGTYCL